MVRRRPWTVQQTADYLGVEPQTAERWARAGKFRRIKLTGRVVRYDPASVEAFASGGYDEPDISAPDPTAAIANERVLQLLDRIAAAVSHDGAG